MPKCPRCLVHHGGTKADSALPMKTSELKTIDTLDLKAIAGGHHGHHHRHGGYGRWYGPRGYAMVAQAPTTIIVAG